MVWTTPLDTRRATRSWRHFSSICRRAICNAGSVTRYTVALDAGGSLQLVRQNVGEAPGAAPEQGAEVLVGWRPQHAAEIRGGNTTKRR